MNLLNSLRLKLHMPIKARISFDAHHGRSSKILNSVGPKRPIWKANALPGLMSLALVTLATVGILIFRQYYPLQQVAIVYLIPVLIAATRWGLVPGIIAAIAGAAATNFFFYPPIYTFWIDDPQHIVDLAIFSFVAFIACDLAERLRIEAEISRQRENDLQNLYTFSRQLAVCSTAADINLATQKFFESKLKCRAVFLGCGMRDDQDMEVIGAHAIPETIRHKAIAIMTTKEDLSQTIIDIATNDAWLIKSLPTQIDDFGVVAVNLGRDSPASVEFVKRQVDAILDEAVAALVRLDIARAISEARTRSQAELFREALVGSVSHELRSPLTSIIGSASVLGHELSIQRNDRIASLIQAIHDEAKRLDTDIEKLLEATRLSDETVRPRMDWHDAMDIINEAIKRKKQRLAGHRIEVDVPQNLPIVKVDSTLLEQALGELLENAAKYSLEGSTIKLSARTEHRRLIIRVCDAGIGLTQGEMVRVGNRSFRGNRRHLLPGSGLGLWIANAFVAAIGGTITAESEGADLGTTISISLPLPHEAISEEADAANG
jgi:two-component system sensor histidine kinase KdpD